MKKATKDDMPSRSKSRKRAGRRHDPDSKSESEEDIDNLPTISVKRAAQQRLAADLKHYQKDNLLQSCRGAIGRNEKGSRTQNRRRKDDGPGKRKTTRHGEGRKYDSGGRDSSTEARSKVTRRGKEKGPCVVQ